MPLRSYSKQNAVDAIIKKKKYPITEIAIAQAPVNIALIKYWGKRNEELHLPANDSLSIALDLKTTTILSQASKEDEILLNGVALSENNPFYERTAAFLSLFRPSSNFFFRVETKNEVPTAAGLASSASGFAALVLALNQFLGWEASTQDLSILARLGSGSAARSLFSGFVRWHKGKLDKGEDSYGIHLPDTLSELHFGVLLNATESKKISSNKAMLQTKETSPIYKTWTNQAHLDLATLLRSIEEKNIPLLGQTAERNSLFMHATMQTAWPSICYWNEKTIVALQNVWKAREQGLTVFCTMDAGPNVKLLYPKKEEKSVLALFPSLWCIPLLWE
jgi:diphosphomevalonate decarboxylase